VQHSRLSLDALSLEVFLEARLLWALGVSIWKLTCSSHSNI
jgi:hypothetical protein